MDSQSFLSGVQYTQLLTITHVEERIRNNFQLIVNELRRKHSQDQERDKQIASFRETTQQLIRRHLIRDQSTQGVVDRDRTAKNLKAVNKGHSADGKDGKQVEQTNGFVISNSQQQIDGVRGDQKSSQKNQMGAQNPELVSMNGECQSDKIILQAMLSYQEMESKLLSSVKEVGQLQRSQSDTANELKKLRQTMETHINNQTIYLNGQGQLKSALKSIQHLGKRVEALEQLCRENESVGSMKLDQLSQTIQQKLNSVREITAQHDEKLTLFSQSIDLLQLKAVQQRPPSSRNKLTLKAKIDPKVGQIEERMNLLERSSECLAGSVQQLQLRIDNLQSKSSRTPRAIEPVSDIPVSETQEIKTKLTDNLLQKMNDMRRQYLSLIKSLREEMQGSLSKLPDFSSLGDSVKELRALVNKKADEQGTKKMQGYLQSRINMIMQEIFREEEEDARIGKTSWFCLSCDRGLKKFKGRIGEHLVADSLKGKKLQKQGREPSPLRNKSKSKVELPRMEKNTDALKK